MLAASAVVGVFVESSSGLGVVAPSDAEVTQADVLGRYRTFRRFARVANCPPTRQAQKSRL